MEQNFSLVLNITVALAAAAGGGFVAGWLRQSPIVGYLLAGVVIGPFTPGFVGDRDTIAALADVGVIFLMFALGVAFSLKDLARIGKVALYGTLVQVLLTIGIAAVLAKLLGWGSFESLFIGCALSASSSMVILKTLLDRGEAAAAHGRLLLSMAIVQDLIVVLLIVLLPKFAQSSEAASVEVIGWDIAVTLFKAVTFIVGFLFLGSRFVPWLMSQVTRLHSSEMFIVVAAVFALGSAAISAYLGLSAALGAFVAGLVLSESEFDHRVISEVVPLRDLFATLFFVSIGMLIDVQFVASHWLWVLGFAGGAILLKALATLMGLLPFKLTPRTAAFTTLGMVPIGELNFVLAQSGLQVNALSLDSYKLILAAAVLTIFVTPFAFRMAAKLAAFFAHSNLLRGCFDSHSNLGGGASSLEAHAVVIGYGRVGQSLARRLRATGMDVAIIDARLTRVREGIADGVTAVYGQASAASVLEAASVANARLIIVALPDHDASLLALRQIRRMNPGAIVAARAEYAASEAVLKNAGANLVVVPELEGATALLHGTLDLLGMPR